ncbi:MAG TPA: hypothetical protein VNZ22_08490 [Bacillota bacterium]|nr:hypothetical protein [Bacillota bacterium]
MGSIMEGTKRTIPAPLWVTIVALGVITLLTLLSLLQSNLLARFAAAVCNLALMVGLVLGHKWAYVLTIVVSVLGVAVGFGKGFSSGLVMLLGNGLVVVPVLLSTRFFFPAEDQR